MQLILTNNYFNLNKNNVTLISVSYVATKKRIVIHVPTWFYSGF